MSGSDLRSSSVRETNASAGQQDAQLRLAELFKQSPLPIADLMTNLGLYLRASALVKVLVIDDLYRRIVEVPGDILEFGVWWGQNMVLFENLRAIHEPFNKTRRVIGFDTFSGYAGITQRDRAGDVFTEGGYSVTADYKRQLDEILRLHESSNVLGHIQGQHRLIEGDVVQTAPRYFVEHPETVVALAYFDLGLYEPTKAALQAVRPHLIPGSVLLLDEFTWSEAPGEAIAFKEVFRDARYRIEKSRFTPMRAIVTIQ